MTDTKSEKDQIQAKAQELIKLCENHKTCLEQQKESVRKQTDRDISHLENLIDWLWAPEIIARSIYGRCNGEYSEENLLNIDLEKSKRMIEKFTRNSDINLNNSTEIYVEEWKECRVSIGRFDNILTDIRKTGFGFVTLLIGTSAFFTQQTGESGQIIPEMKIVLFSIISIIIIMLYLIDRIHYNWLIAAAKRAKFLESILSLCLTKDLSESINVKLSDKISNIIYLCILFSNFLVFYFAIILKNGTSFDLKDLFPNSGYEICMVIIFFLSVIILFWILLKIRNK